MSESNQTLKSHDKPSKLNRKLPSKKALLITLWVIAMVLVGYGSYTISKNNATAANRSAEKALNALEAKDSNTIYELGTEEFKKASNKEAVTKVVNQWNKVISEKTTGEPKLHGKQVGNVKNKERTTLIYKYTLKEKSGKKNGSELYVSIVTEKVGDEHKLHTFNLDSQ